jgi:hypothetical protein
VTTWSAPTLRARGPAAECALESQQMVSDSGAIPERDRGTATSDYHRVVPHQNHVSGHRSQMPTFSSVWTISGWPTIRGLMEPRCPSAR